MNHFTIFRDQLEKSKGIEKFCKEPNKYNFILDPHTATAVGASKKNKDESETLILATAHPYKFLETIKLATSKEIKTPIQLSNILDKEEKYDILDNKISDVKNYILGKL